MTFLGLKTILKMVQHPTNCTTTTTTAALQFQNNNFQFRKGENLSSPPKKDCAKHNDVQGKLVDKR